MFRRKGIWLCTHVLATADPNFIEFIRRYEGSSPSPPQGISVFPDFVSKSEEVRLWEQLMPMVEKRGKDMINDEMLSDEYYSSSSGVDGEELFGEEDYDLDDVVQRRLQLTAFDPADLSRLADKDSLVNASQSKEGRVGVDIRTQLFPVPSYPHGKVEKLAPFNVSSFLAETIAKERLPSYLLRERSGSAASSNSRINKPQVSRVVITEHLSPGFRPFVQPSHIGASWGYLSLLSDTTLELRSITTTATTSSGKLLGGAAGEGDDQGSSFLRVFVPARSLLVISDEVRWNWTIAESKHPKATFGKRKWEKDYRVSLMFYDHHVGLCDLSLRKIDEDAIDKFDREALEGSVTENSSSPSSHCSYLMSRKRTTLFNGGEDLVEVESYLDTEELTNFATEKEGRGATEQRILASVDTSAGDLAKLSTKDKNYLEKGKRYYESPQEALEDEYRSQRGKGILGGDLDPLQKKNNPLKSISKKFASAKTVAEQIAIFQEEAAQVSMSNRYVVSGPGAENFDVRLQALKGRAKLLDMEYGEVPESVQDQGRVQGSSEEQAKEESFSFTRATFVQPETPSTRSGLLRLMTLEKLLKREPFDLNHISQEMERQISVEKKLKQRQDILKSSAFAADPKKQAASALHTPEGVTIADTEIPLDLLQYRERMDEFGVEIELPPSSV